MVQGVYIDRAQSARLTFDKALSRYLSEVVPTKKPATQETDKYCAEPLRAYFGKYSLAAISPDLVAGYRGKRLATPLKRVNRATGDPVHPVIQRVVVVHEHRHIREGERDRIGPYPGSHGLAFDLWPMYGTIPYKENRHDHCCRPSRPAPEP